MDAMLEAICEAKLQWFLGVVERLCAEEEAFAIALLERLGIPVISKATRDALADVSRRVRRGLPVRRRGDRRRAVRHQRLVGGSRAALIRIVLGKIDAVPATGGLMGRSRSKPTLVAHPQIRGSHSGW